MYSRLYLVFSFIPFPSQLSCTSVLCSAACAPNCVELGAAYMKLIHICNAFLPTFYV